MGVITKRREQVEKIYLAGGCFWGLEAYYRRLPGILSCRVGYANGKTDQTSYRELGVTGHAETVEIVYDAGQIKLAEVLDRFYLAIDPLSVNRQGNDVGSQYRSGIYYVDEDSASICRISLEILAYRLQAEPAIELQPLKHFIQAEDYHQDYVAKNEGAYCHINLQLAGKKLYPGPGQEADSVLKAKLPDQLYQISQRQGTEMPHSSGLNQEERPGIYVDAINGQPLFSSDDKYDAGCGWPSFTMPITSCALDYREDNSLARQRTEVVTESNRSHLGHVFPDGPLAKGGLRYCINGACLTFIPLEEMRDRGYAELIPYVSKHLS